MALKDKILSAISTTKEGITRENTESLRIKLERTSIITIITTTRRVRKKRAYSYYETPRIGRTRKPIDQFDGRFLGGIARYPIDEFDGRFLGGIARYPIDEFDGRFL